MVSIAQVRMEKSGHIDRQLIDNRFVSL